ncbi:MAG: NAD(+) synthase [Pseudomonadota bacterium]
MDHSSLNLLRVAACSPEISIGDCRANTAAILSTCESLAQEQVSIAVCPELCISGYSAEDLFFSSALLEDAHAALVHLSLHNPLPILVVGLPWRLADGRLLNCAAVIANNRVVGLVPKTVQPNYGEFYDQRWFVSGGSVNEVCLDQELGRLLLRTDLLFELEGHRIGIEICEDLWSPQPPSTDACLAGATIMLNLSASNELIAKSDYRRDLVKMASAKNICAYVYANAGPTESTKDIVFGGHCMIFESGVCLGENQRFEFQPEPVIADIDTDKLLHDRSQNTTFAQATRPTSYRIAQTNAHQRSPTTLLRPSVRQPFVPDDEAEFAARAQEILAIQSTGLARRMQAAQSENLVIGLSGGLDSTLAYLVCLDALAKLEKDVARLHAITMPGPGTTQKTLNNTHRLCSASGATLMEISIEAAVKQHLQDLQHEGELDVVFENAQARERTQILFNYANKARGIVVGTGDLSELALGWCTYNADHMASYNVNASVPKTLIAYLVRWYANHRADQFMADVLHEVLDTPISPELLPPEDGEISQRTEDIVGPYELHDFFLYHYLRNGATPEKIYYYAVSAFAQEYDQPTIKKWLRTFFQRFFTQQFKRTTLPPGPKVGSVSLSPRGDWRMPDEASASALIARIDEFKTTEA